MKNKSDVIIIVVALLLVVGLVGTLLAFSRSFDKAVNSSVESSVESDSSTSGDNSANNSQSAPDGRYIDSDGYGYQTVSGITSFFKRCELSPEDKAALKRGEGEYLRICLTNGVMPYGSFVVNNKVSLDGILWSDFSFDYLIDGSDITDTYYSEFNDLNIQYVYVSYTFVTNCFNPRYVLNDLKANVFIHQTDGIYDYFNPYLDLVGAGGLG